MTISSAGVFGIGNYISFIRRGCDTPKLASFPLTKVEWGGDTPQLAAGFFIIRFITLITRLRRSVRFSFGVECIVNFLTSPSKN